MRRVVIFAVATTASAFLVLGPGFVLASPRHAPHVCSGTSSKPGVLTGRWRHGVVVRGTCEVNSGAAQVVGPITLKSGSALLAAFGKKGSKLTVNGDVTVGQGATLVLGCNTTSFPCLDDPAATSHSIQPTLMSPAKVTGDITSNAPLGVIVHSTTVGGDITQTSGGGGPSCAPPKTGAFSMFGSPVYTDYEDNTVTGDLTVTKLNSCYLGIIRNHVDTLKVTYDTLSDPDAIEIETNVVKGNLACWHDKQNVWDSADLSPTGALYPRKLGRNTVDGKRMGQCVKAGPLTQGGPDAGGPF